ncbi:hypothetical protein RJT34_25866 [Clitoria ternatea]|uniref:Uncharacterized protein n=1 Tax=Clitoria ternatea TaxID=43366 RepID=A0AAN9FQL3_CLITE
MISMELCSLELIYISNKILHDHSISLVPKDCPGTVVGQNYLSDFHFLPRARASPIFPDLHPANPVHLHPSLCPPP